MMPNATRYASVLVVVLSVQAWPVEAQDFSTSRYFQISDYYYPDRNGDYQSYSVHGFVEQGPEKSKKTVFILPSLSYELKGIRFLNSRGQAFNPASEPDVLPRAIRLPIMKRFKLPENTQLPALGAAIARGAGVPGYLPPLLRDPNGGPLIYAPSVSLPGVVQGINQAYNRYGAELSRQSELIDSFKNYRPELINLSELSINVLVNNNIVGSISFNGSYVSSSDRLGSVEVVDPDEYIFNRIREGDFNLQASYKFRNENTGYINAQFDASRIVNKFLSHAQRSMIESKESGWKVLGIGSRRKTLRQIFNEEIQENNDDSRVSNTVIEIFDASEDMIKQFESIAFPSVSMDKVIETHLAAASDANISQELRQFHLNYAQALRDGRIDLETDIAGAAAALTQKDYASFIAKGVRFGSEKEIGNIDFRRVVQQSAEVDSITRWMQTKTISVQHALTQDIDIQKQEEGRALIGLCDAAPIPFQIPIFNVFNQVVSVQQKTFLVLTCIQEGSPLARAGLMPGVIVSEFNGRPPPTNLQELVDRLREFEPGDRVTLSTLLPGPVPQYQRHQIQLGKGPPLCSAAVTTRAC